MPFGLPVRGSAISIHALREEGDQLPLNVRQAFGIFLSTPSARRATGRRKCKAHISLDFYPRPPRGGRPWTLFTVAVTVLISIHALREEGDCVMGYITIFTERISIHALREEGDPSCTGTERR